MTADRCLVCGRSDTRSLLDLPAVPVQSTALYDDADRAAAAPTGRLRLVGCRHCSAVTNAAFDEAAVPYDGAYENSQLFSPTFRAFAEEVSDGLRERYALTGGHVVEVGCGKGEFLAMLTARASMRGTGYDPTYEGEVDAPVDGAPAAVQVLRQPYDEHARAEPADLVCCRHVLEHIASPLPFLRSIRRPMQPTTVFYLEVPNAAFTFTASGLWDLIYQHCTYFTAEALEGVTKAAGFEVRATRSVFERQFLALEAVASDAPDDERTVPLASGARETIESFAQVSTDFERLVGSWDARLREWHEAGRRVAFWGAGAKGVTFLTLVASSNALAAVVDVNVRKHGRYLAGTRHAVVAPDRLRTLQPDVVIAANAAYEGEIEAALVDMGVRAELLTL